MSKLLNGFAEIIARSFDTSSKHIYDLKIIDSLFYSPTLFEEMSSKLCAKIIEELKNEPFKIGLDDLDTVFICDFNFSDKSYTAIVYDYAELYYPAFVWKIIAN